MKLIILIGCLKSHDYFIPIKMFQFQYSNYYFSFWALFSSKYYRFEQGIKPG